MFPKLTAVRGRRSAEVCNISAEASMQVVRTVGSAICTCLYRATNLSLRWLINYSRERTGRTMAMKLANEIIDASNEVGSTIKKKEETHRMAEANKAFAHFRY